MIIGMIKAHPTETVAFAGFDPVAAAVRRPPGAAPGDRLGAVGWAGLAGVGDEAEAAAGKWGEGFSIVGRSWHVSRIGNRRRGTKLGSGGALVGQVFEQR
jgi:hypothetical protein